MNKKQLATWRKEVRSILDADSDVWSDKTVAKKDGTMEIKMHYFYRHGNTDAKWGTKIMKSPIGKISNLVRTYDDYRSWPKDSYFVAVIEPKES